MRDFQLPGRSPVYSTNGMCATSHPLAAKVAVQMLEAGGNAVDAAIAGAVLLGICEPHMTGIGGDCFALVAPAGGPIVALNGSGRAPAGLSAEAMLAAGHLRVPTHGPEAVTVPGAVDAFCRLSADWGELGLAASLAPAIHYAETGVPVAPRVSVDWAAAAQALRGAAERHYLFDGHPPALGGIFRAPGQAEVLRRIATEGRDAFYTGEVAEDMLAALREQGGVHTADDFAAAESGYGDPVSGWYRGIELVEHPPNGQGAAAILLAQILETFDLASLDPEGPERAHLLVEATKLAYDARDRFIADPSHASRIEHLLSPETARRLASLVDPARAMLDPRRAAAEVHRETVLITVVDRDRLAVSLIYSIYHAFGSGIASPKFGILLHNRGAGFTLETGHPNQAAGGKRPLHTIIPAMLREGGHVTATFGVMGGAYQATGHAHMLSNLVDYGMDPQEAIDAPRLFPENGVVRIERGYPRGLAEALRERGHEVIEAPGPIGGAQMIRLRDDGVLEAGSDPRKDGCALGY